MYFVIMAEDTPNSLEQRLQTRAAHLERLEVLNAGDRLLLAGPCPAIDSETPGAAGFTGSLIVAEFPSWAEAKTWANADPYIAAGVYKSVVIKPFKKVYPSC